MSFAAIPAVNIFFPFFFQHYSRYYIDPSSLCDLYKNSNAKFKLKLNNVNVRNVWKCFYGVENMWKFEERVRFTSFNRGI